MEQQISPRLKSDYRCYAECSEQIIYFDGKPVMKIYTSFFQHSYGRKSYSKLGPSGGYQCSITREEFYKELERLKSA